MASADDVPRDGGARGRLIVATARLLAVYGPSAIKVRAVAAEAGLSTMAVYSHFGGVPELTRAVIGHGFNTLDAAFAGVPVTNDPVADLAAMALTCRRVAHDSPHLYDLMFGLSTRATYRPLTCENRPGAATPAFGSAYAHILKACQRLVRSGRVRHQDPTIVAAQLWSLVHGFITLELADTFAANDDAVREVLIPLGINLSVGLGDSRERAALSHERAAKMLG
ncbi:transcriptional regulator [Mycobacterium sp. 852013-50091_SCH5140682]|uniref:TetR/AcrR family transcriptional regulator n=1 Tax=Mycobacterium sp. 852013-50091_SCH5140682 TaxID=1834109 RepID=UPI0007EC0DB9|nr:WHG domain-containing protein [Mycobacterium sp. 852013-50091_SCH5140682]OBC12620.1 transcriptional regulator [Mycobacterium sp. 852013-50091_SCH5140682]